MNPETDKNTIPGEQHILNLQGFVRSSSTVPTYVPRHFYEQVVVVVTGGNMSLYIYDVENLLWRSTTLV